jgi:broad specificity phosphatase PhoE
MDIKKVKKIKFKIQTEILKKLKSVKSIISVTFVGSFIDKNSIDIINDIDVVVIVDKLNKNIFNKCLNQIKLISTKTLGVGNKELLINTNFGPLKFNSENNLVIHLMVYDREGHKNHVTYSPFTCYDWERSNIFHKSNLSGIFPVGTLQSRDFLDSRRGINDYINDLKKGIVSYKKYKFKNKNYVFQNKSAILIGRRQYEYYYHIINFLIKNYIKFILQKNLKENYKYFFKKNFSKNFLNNYYFIINLLKKIKDNNYTHKLNKKYFLIKFINNFYKIFNRKIIKKSKTVFFVRHQKTKLNNDTFLGQNRNPSIIESNITIDKNFDKFITSPMKRTIESLKLFSKCKTYNQDKDLLEINYGLAEGLNFKELKSTFPHISKAWNKRRDVKFPKGESYKDVNIRVNCFVNKLLKYKEKSFCIMTHNVFLRCLIGSYYNIKSHNWHKIYIPHLTLLEFKILNNRLYPNISRLLLKEIFSKL